MDTKTSIKQTWQTQIRQIAARNPRLARQIWQNRPMYFERFAHFYRQLSNLPRKFRRKFMKRLATTVAGAALLLALGQALPVRAATITVDGVTCTLADAITSANTDTAVGGCAAGGGADMIDLQTDVTLSAPLPSITSEVILNGNGHTIDGNHLGSVLQVTSPGNLTLNKATITGGDAIGVGGGVYNYGGTVAINESTISGNYANSGGGIANLGYGTITITNSVIDGNSANHQGGGIENGWSTTLTVNNSVVSGNSASIGGGVRNYGDAILNNTTISGNDAGLGGGFYSYLSSTLTMNNCTISGNSASSGGGFAFLYGTGTINNSTISGNMATGQGGGIWGFYENVTINNATITDNTAPRGGGIFRYFPTNGMVLNRSIISGNHASSGGPEVYAQNGPWNINNYNVVGYGGSTRSYSLTIGSTDVIPSGALNSLLNPTLSSNGGPTLAHALVSGSVAMDLAPTTACTNAPISGLDQRGAVRVFDGDGTPSSNECDSGAVEMRETITVGTCGGTALSGSYDFTFLTGNTITIDILNGNGLTCLSIEETGPGVNHPLATGPGPSGVGLLTGNWWHIRGDVNTGLNVEVTLPYTSANSDSRVCKWPGGLGGAGWDCGPLDGTGTNFIGNTSVTRSNLSSFSDWAVGQKVGPTAVSLEQVTVSTEKRGGFLAGLISVMGFALYTVSLRRKKQSSN